MIAGSQVFHFWLTLKTSHVAENQMPTETFTEIYPLTFWNASARSLSHLKVLHMLKISFIYEVHVPLQQWNLCGQN